MIAIQDENLNRNTEDGCSPMAIEVAYNLCQFFKDQGLKPPTGLISIDNGLNIEWRYGEISERFKYGTHIASLEVRKDGSIEYSFIVNGRCIV